MRARRCGMRRDRMSMWVTARVAHILILSLNSLLQTTHYARILLRQRLSLLVGDGFGDDMEEGAISVGQHQHPFFAEVNLDAVDGLGAAFAVLLAQDTHHLALVFPGAVDGCAAQVVGRE